MKIAVLGDLHIGHKNGSKLFLDETQKFLHNQFFPKLLEYDVQAVVQLGDTLDKRKNVDFVVSRFLQREWFTWFQENRIPLYSVVGNHDIYYRESLDVVGPDILNDSEYVHFIKQPKNIPDIGDLIPWICEENLSECESFVSRSHERFCFGHFELSGFPISRGHISEKGTLPLTLFSRYEQVVSGHFHSASKSANIEYLGTPYELTWSDSGEDKKFRIMDTETGLIEDIINPVKMFIKLEYSEDIETLISEETMSGKFLKVSLPEVYDEENLNKFLDKTASLEIDLQIIPKSVSDEESSIEISYEDPIQLTRNIINNEAPEDIRPLVLDIFEESLKEIL